VTTTATEGSAGKNGTAADQAISVRGLRMSYGRYEAVRGIDFDVTRGEILAFLGPNEAGKTTTTEILEGFRKRTAGDVTVLGAHPGRAGPGWPRCARSPMRSARSSGRSRPRARSPCSSCSR
jgi:ABC-2 type transport system ATP-binding protein